MTTAERPRTGPLSPHQLGHVIRHQRTEAAPISQHQCAWTTSGETGPYPSAARSSENPSLCFPRSRCAPPHPASSICTASAEVGRLPGTQAKGTWGKRGFCGASGQSPCVLTSLTRPSPDPLIQRVYTGPSQGCCLISVPPHAGTQLEASRPPSPTSCKHRVPCLGDRCLLLEQCVSLAKDT